MRRRLRWMPIHQRGVSLCKMEATPRRVVSTSCRVCTTHNIQARFRVISLYQPRRCSQSVRKTAQTRLVGSIAPATSERISTIRSTTHLNASFPAAELRTPLGLVAASFRSPARLRQIFRLPNAIWISFGMKLRISISAHPPSSSKHRQPLQAHLQRRWMPRPRISDWYSNAVLQTELLRWWIKRPSRRW